MNRLFVIAGFARCGTTWFHNRLVKHSRIKPALGHVKEIGYFEHAHRAELNAMSGGRAWGDRVDRANLARFPMLMRRHAKLGARADVSRPEDAADLRQQMREIITFIDEFGRDDDWYRALFTTTDDDWAIDSTPSYSRLPDSAIRHMGGLADQVKVALVMREPGSRLKSLIQHNVRQQDRWLSDSSEKIVRMISGRENPYLDRVEAFRRNLNEDQLVTFFFEDLLRERGFDTAALLTKLGLAPEPEVFEEEPAPNASAELFFDRNALLALADHSERVAAEVKAHIGAIPPEWESAAARFRAQAEAAPSQQGLSKQETEPPRNWVELEGEIDRLQRGHRSGAVLDLLTTYLAARGEDAFVRMLRAETLERMGRFDQALKDLERARSNGADPALCAAAMSRLARVQALIEQAKEQVQQRKAEGAIETLKKIDDSEGQTLKLFLLARAQLILGDKTSAKMNIARFLCEQPDHKPGKAVWERAFSL